MTDEQEAPEVVKPSCIVKWDAPGSAEITVEIDGCTPPQLWAAAKMIEHFANELYANGRTEQMAAQIREQLENQGIAQQLMGAQPKIIPVHGHIKRSDA
jgi:hypothetical protein